jgi:hypothetical protein
MIYLYLYKIPQFHFDIEEVEKHENKTKNHEENITNRSNGGFRARNTWNWSWNYFSGRKV